MMGPPKVFGGRHEISLTPPLSQVATNCCLSRASAGSIEIKLIVLFGCNAFCGVSPFLASSATFSCSSIIFCVLSDMYCFRCPCELDYVPRSPVQRSLLYNDLVIVTPIRPSFWRSFWMLIPRPSDVPCFGDCISAGWRACPFPSLLKLVALVLLLQADCPLSSD